MIRLEYEGRTAIRTGKKLSEKELQLALVVVVGHTVVKDRQGKYAV